LRRLSLQGDSIIRLAMDEEIADGAYGDDTTQSTNPPRRLRIVLNLLLATEHI